MNKVFGDFRFWLIFFVFLITLLAFLLIKKTSQELPPFQVIPQEKDADVNNFRDCATKGYAVMESLPRKCITPDSRVFLEE